MLKVLDILTTGFNCRLFVSKEVLRDTKLVRIINNIEPSFAHYIPTIDFTNAIGISLGTLLTGNNVCLVVDCYDELLDLKTLSIFTGVNFTGRLFILTNNVSKIKAVVGGKGFVKRFSAGANLKRINVIHYGAC